MKQIFYSHFCCRQKLYQYRKIIPAIDIIYTFINYKNERILPFDIKSPTAFCVKEICLQVPIHPEGIEPPAPEPESGILSVKLWVPSDYFFELDHCITLYFKKQKNFLFFAFYLQFNLIIHFFC